MKLHITKRGYLHTFTLVVVLLALARCCHDYFSMSDGEDVTVMDSTAIADREKINDMESVEPGTSDGKAIDMDDQGMSVLSDGNFKPHRILSVPNYGIAFPDSNSVQLVSAKRYGVTPVANRIDAEKRKAELVYVGSNPYFYVDRLHESIPYLVPRANNLLQSIGRAFFDSLYVKGVPLHKIIITSVLRTEEDVARLRTHNNNASENSCHRFGTTFDICYNRYKTVQTKSQPRRQVQNDTLKWVLAEVLRDQRESGRCYIKYEVHQGCFHITVR